ncbi:peroxiredoxin-like family protein [Pseudocolwellia sp. HL-MZ19]|uniref:peroxiredoxin-like family protein n=1 Tax=unclassified Pseudocolwellia TaxID=2848178 RepID=UPI003CEA5312
MTTLKQQTEAQIAKTRAVKPEFMQKLDEVLNTAREFQEGGNAIAIGAQAPNFTLPNEVNQNVELAGLLAKGPVVVTFYRGSWCPYCNLQLRALKERLTEIHGLGAELVAISPEVPDDSLSEDERISLEFPVLSDQDALIAAAYGVAWKVPELVLDHMRKDRNLELSDINNGNGSVLPLPATFVINTDGNVVWRFVDVDYRIRSEPEDIVNALKALAAK